MADDFEFWMNDDELKGDSLSSSSDREQGELGSLSGDTFYVDANNGPWGSVPNGGYWSDTPKGYGSGPANTQLRNYQIYARAMAVRLINDARVAWGNEVFSQVYARLMLGLQEWAKVMYEETASGGSEDELTKMHAALSERVQDAIVESYKEHHVPGKTLPYRWMDQGKMHRFSNRAMLRALDDRNQFMKSDKTGIQMVNTEFLDDVAPQWYRLNFGAMPAPQTAPESGGNMKWGGGAYRKNSGIPTNIKVVANGKPSKPFFVPELLTNSRRGLWSRAFMAESNISQIITGLGSGKARGVKSGDGRPYAKDLGRGITNSGGYYKRGAEGPGFVGVSKGMPFKAASDQQASLNSPKRSLSLGALYIVGGTRGQMGSLGFEKRISKGISGSRFLDAGTTLLNDEYGSRLHEVFQKWMFKGLKAGKGKAEAPWGRFSGTVNGKQFNLARISTLNDTSTTYSKGAMVKSQLKDGDLLPDGRRARWTGDRFVFE